LKCAANFETKKSSNPYATIGVVRVARWYIFKPKNPNLGKFWRALEWNIIWSFGLFYGHWEKLKVIW
jgi:hypothetical protein